MDCIDHGVTKSQTQLSYFHDNHNNISKLYSRALSHDDSKGTTDLQWDGKFGEFTFASDEQQIHNHFVKIIPLDFLRCTFCLVMEQIVCMLSFC